MGNFLIIATDPEKREFSSFKNFPKDIYGNSWEDTTDYNNNPYLHSCYLLIMDDQCVGRFAIYNNPKLSYKNKCTLCIGSYECKEDERVSRVLLEMAIAKCKELRAHCIIGPMNGSTWDNYRFAKEDSNRPFFLEPVQKPYYNHQFMKVGFKPIGNYISNLDKDLIFDKNQLQKFEKHYLNKGAKFRNIDLMNIQNELMAIAKFCNEAFKNNFLFTPIDPKVFVKKYMRVASFFDEKLIWIVENSKEEIEAIFFAIKDIMDPLGETLIIKTMAIKPNSSFKGIATYLAKKTSQLAKENGFKKIIHALIIDGNMSGVASKKNAQSTYRKYALYGYEI